jgi:diguanylate cyclase (GGDEF)-like protein
MTGSERTYTGGLARGAGSHSERDRLRLVTSLGLLDRIGDPVLTALVRLAQQITGASAAAVHVFDADHQRRIAAVGAPLADHPAKDSMCRVVIESGARLITTDATREDRLSYSTFTTDPTAPVRFYASLPLTMGGRVTVGTLCAFDPEPRRLSEDQIGRLQDIAFLVQAHLEAQPVADDVRDEARLDPLTGAVNRVIFSDRLTHALNRARRRGARVLVSMVDLDDFTALNESHGHTTGEEILRRVAIELTRCVRSEDTVGRLGGDEFGVVAEVASTGVDALLERLDRARDGIAPACRLSIGTVIAEPQDTAATVLARAEAELYANKRARKRAQMR